MEHEKAIRLLRSALSKQPLPVEEKSMFQSLCFMVDDKMCICTKPDHLLCRIGKDRVDLEIEKGGGRAVIMKGRPVKDFIFVDHESIQTAEDLYYWIRICLQFNPLAKSSRKK